MKKSIITLTILAALMQGCVTNGGRSDVWEKTETQKELQMACGKTSDAKMIMIKKPKGMDSYMQPSDIRTWKSLSLTSNNLRCNGWGSPRDIAAAKTTAKSMKISTLCYEVHAQRKMIKRADIYGIGTIGAWRNA